MENLLDLGCGWTNRTKAGYKLIKLDLDSNCNPDIICDLEGGKLPFLDNYLDKIQSYNCLEHISHDAYPKLLEEMYRVSKPDAIIFLRVPHFSNGLGMWMDLTHWRCYTSRSFMYFGDISNVHHYNNYLGTIKAKFHVLRFKIQFSEITELGNIRLQNYLGFSWFATKFASLYERFLYGIFPAQSIDFWLQVKK